MLQFFRYYLDPLFDDTQVTGMFSLEHFLLLGVFLIFAIFGIRWMLKRTLAQREQIFRIYAIFLIIHEIIRVSWNIIVSQQIILNDVLPFYTCGIFLLAMPLSAFNTPLKKYADSFIKISTVLSGAAFLLFPSTALVDYPIIHYNTLQAFIMHTTMMMTGILYWLPPEPQTTWHDWKVFCGWIIIYGSISMVINNVTGSNLMFVGDPLPNTPLVWVETIVGPFFYGVMIILLHFAWGAMMTWIASSVYKLTKRGN